MYIDPLEKFMDEYVDTAIELRGLFKIQSSNIVDDNLFAVQQNKLSKRQKEA